MSDKIKFNDTEYTETSLKTMSSEDLLELRNVIASNLGVGAVKGFKDQPTAVVQTWKALQRFESGASADAGTKKAKVKKEPKERGLAKSAEAKVVKRPTKKMFSTIKKVGEHDGSQGRIHRWPNYKDGMTVVDVIETEGTEPWDVYNWQNQNIMLLTEPTDDEFVARKAAWYKKHGLTDPEEAKRLRSEERAKAKVERDKATEEKKVARDKAAADKKTAAEAKKAKEA